jgi:ABC-type uncharacterized transport system permease subunit
MKRSLGIALHLAAADLRGNMQYRADFVAQVAVGIVWQCTSFLFLWVVLSRFHWRAFCGSSRRTCSSCTSYSTTRARLPSVLTRVECSVTVAVNR